MYLLPIHFANDFFNIFFKKHCILKKYRFHIVNLKYY